MATVDHQYRGVETHREQDPNKRYRDTRSPLTRFVDATQAPGPAAIMALSLAAVPWLFPAAAQVTWIFLLPLFFAVRSNLRVRVLPFRLPTESNTKDYRDVKPGGHGHRKARGEYFFGTEANTNNQLYLAQGDILRHILLFGTTGSGKTQSLLGYAANFFLMGAGLIFSDAKASPDLEWKIAGLARKFGRDDDVFVMNYLTGTRVASEYDPVRLSNTQNPFAIGNSDSLVQIMSALLPTVEGDNAVFGERAIALLRALFAPLVELRNAGYIRLGVDVLARHLSINALYSLAIDERVSTRSRQVALDYLNQLPGIQLPEEWASPSNTARPETIPVDDLAEAERQFGFARMYFTQALSSLSETYGHIYLTSAGEIDYEDIVRNRRILVIMLPALEKAPPELASLAKINLSSVRDALKIGLGGAIEGDREDVLDSLPTNSRTASVVILDEYAYQTVDGFAITAAQARGLGFSFVFAGQDYAGFRRANEGEAEQIIANTNLKIVMKLEDPQATWNLVKDLAGEADVAMTRGGQQGQDKALLYYKDTGEANYERRNRVDIVDFKAMVEGQALMFFNEHRVRANVFVPGDENITPDRHKINRFVKLSIPRESDVPAMSGAIDGLHGVMAARAAGDQKPAEVLDPDEMAENTRTILTVFDALQEQPAYVRGLAAVVAVHTDTLPVIETNGSGGSGGGASSQNATPVSSASTVDDLISGPSASSSPEQSPKTKDEVIHLFGSINMDPGDETVDEFDDDAFDDLAQTVKRIEVKSGAKEAEAEEIAEATRDVAAEALNFSLPDANFGSADDVSVDDEADDPMEEILIGDQGSAPQSDSQGQGPADAASKPRPESATAFELPDADDFDDAMLEAIDNLRKRTSLTD